MKQDDGEDSENGCFDQKSEESDEDYGQPKINLFGFGGLIKKTEDSGVG